MAKKQMKVTLVRSMFGTGARHQACVRGLGLRRLHHSVLVEDSAATRGMVRKVAYMVKCEEVA
ncbi:50S ribosomal protein L30 [Acidiferrobacter thiooxydans]|jgi:large subunit ribosomal protein L30|uniref:Large ribosomal subunit protein uL30 n=1 Tax=Acidiferrobacter thiooxydans TaxID=163359 RepID=A0A1C2FXQ6_9GAMM|nr:50S ribosomal protein L30 [Acidiferrobacter thiooxydans]MDA8192045.1 50S ribosomal protein L30 [Gammaproteobacteria bacterium]RCN58724.1 50S ribosomal protein L30 [Acidiferrobacter thiooxydans]UEO00351.1 50S ribosomal protein L30 [Acidiferrobacter thiooxydans]